MSIDKLSANADPARKRDAGGPEHLKVGYLHQIVSSLLKWTMAGGAAALVLSAIEWIDLTFRISPYLSTHLENLVLASYYSISVLGGLITGLGIGIGFTVASFVKGLLERVFGGRTSGNVLSRAASLFLTASLFAIVLNLYSPSHRYLLAQIREAEKIHLLNQPLLNHERATSLALCFSLLLASWCLWVLTERFSSLRRNPSVLLLAGIFILIVIVYVANSRLEPELYEHSLHLSFFLLNTTLGMSFTAGLYLSSSRLKQLSLLLKHGGGRVVAALLVVLFAGSVIFTFLHIDRDQTLKVLTFYRTVESRTNFELLHRMLDFDGDGYSSLLGGGDTNDSRADINPAAIEIVGDGVDNNGIGGDLTNEEVAAWHEQFASARRPPDANAKRLNVIYIFVDALRADHLGVYGYNRGTSKNIDRLASRSVVFLNGYTAAPNTFEALPKFMKSCYWDAHVPTWTEVLANNGYDTMLFPRRAETLLRHVKGMKEVYRRHAGGRSTLEQTVDDAIKVLGERHSDQPFCAYLYSVNPHRPYHKRPQFPYGSGTTDLYDGEIGYVDNHFGRLFDWLEKSGHMEDTMIVFMADHGESLGERLVYKHSTQLYNEQTHIPMIVYIPGIAPRRVPDYVTSVDLGATILSAVGLQCPIQYAGVNLVPSMRGQEFAHPPVYGEQTTREDSPFVVASQQIYPPRKKYMVIAQDGFKLIYDRDFDCFELYDLKHDPGEFHNLYDQMPERAQQMKQMVGRYIDVLLVSRPADADEQQYLFKPGSGAESEEGN